MGNDPVYDCQSCGACCVRDRHISVAYIFLAGDEPQRLKRMGLPVVQVSGESYLGTRTYRGGHRACVAFRGEIGVDCGCSIYEARPSICRQFEMGDPLCREARARMGLPV